MTEVKLIGELVDLNIPEGTIRVRTGTLSEGFPEHKVTGLSPIEIKAIAPHLLEDVEIVIRPVKP